MPATLNVSALVLRRSEYRDYDRMLTLLTAEHGKVEAVARGCRRPKSELLNAAEPFVCGQYQLYFAHERYSVLQCRVTESFYDLRQDMDRLTLGAKWLKKLESVAVADQEQKELLDMALSALSYLTYSETDIRLLDAMFLMKLLYLSGFAPSADRCAVCGKSANEVKLGFDARRGGCVCPGCVPYAKPLSEGARRILFKAPKTPYSAVEKLIPHPDWPEAADRISEFAEEILSGR